MFPSNFSLTEHRVYVITTVINETSYYFVSLEILLCSMEIVP